MHAQPTRRAFMRGMAASTLALSAAAAFADGERLAFLHGVASGDPLADRVILWTRVTPAEEWRARKERAAWLDAHDPHEASGRSIELRWEIARDPGFKHISASGRTHTRAASDYTVKVDATGLRPATTYWYRFSADGVRSPVGRTRTLPRGSVAQVRLAVFSCSNYPAGHFNVYRDAAAAAALEGIDAALHLGDYLYEYDRAGYASERAAELGRLSDPANELLILADYRQRHAQYRADVDLQALHAALPVIAVWDDHEFANDAWQDGAQNHQPGEGDWPARRAAAMQAYHEWLPIRLRDPQRPDVISRSFDFGDLLSLHMLDTRIVGRDRQLSLSDFANADGFDGAAFGAALADPGRELLGAEQLVWLQGQLAHSSATWQVLGQQVLMARMQVPAPLILGQISVTGYIALVTKAQTAPTTLTPAELAILRAPSIPYNLDAWDGYAVAREQVLGAARALDKNLVVLAGDTHNAWASDLADARGTPVGVEFATPSVSSPGFEAIFPDENPQVLAGALQQLIGPLVYANTHQRGYLLLTATPDEMQAQWRYVDTVFDRRHQAIEGPTLRTLPGVDGRRILSA